MASSGGSSLSHWRLLVQLRNYLLKFYPSKENIQNDIVNLIKLSSTKSQDFNDKTNNQVLAKNPQDQQQKIDDVSNIATPNISEESKISYDDWRKALHVLNAYLPQLPSFRGGDPSTEPMKEPVPKWLLKKRDSVSKSSVDARTRHLVTGLQHNLSESSYLRRIEDFSSHLKNYPFTRGAAIKCSGVSRLLKVLQATKDPSLKEAAREALALLGYHPPVSGNGIRILSIDGGGMRGLVALEVLRHLEIKTGKPIYQLFDFVCGVSTGAIIAVLVGAHRLPLSECEELYRKISTKVFSQTRFRGTASLVWKNSFYDSDAWTNILKEHMGDIPMMETSKDENFTKICLVSTQANANWIKAFLFRNYVFPYRVASHFNGSCSNQLWEGVRASAAAPGYFSEFMIDDLVLLDGGVLVNNPTSIAVHEARQLWSDTPLQTVVSVGTGKHEPLALVTDRTVNWAMRLRTIINSATDTEGVHTTLHDLLPNDVYFRLNPYLSEEIGLDEIREDKLATMIEDTALYLRKNEARIDEAALSLTKPKNATAKIKDQIAYRRLLWDI